jgi:methyl-accepting chemotaxis protein
MSNPLTGKFLPQFRFKLGTKAVLCAVLLIAVNTALVVGAGYWSLRSEFNDRALRDIEVNLRTLALAFAEIVPDAKITMKDGMVVRAEIPKMPDFKDHAIVSIVPCPMPAAMPRCSCSMRSAGSSSVARLM